MCALIYVTTQDKYHFSVRYEANVDPARQVILEALWKHFNRYDPATNKNHYIWYRPTNRKLEMHIDYSLPEGTLPGKYRIEAFIPGRHATTRSAIYSVAHNFRSIDGQLRYDDKVAVVDMYHLYDVWLSLGEYDLDTGTNALSGRVRQYELSSEDPPTEVSFGPIRWASVLTDPGGDLPRFDAPIGSKVERDGPFAEGQMAFGLYPVLVGNWYDANPYLSWYTLGYHTGSDLNLPGSSDADRDAPIFAIADGTVIYAGAAGSWGNIIVIKHPDALVTIPTTGEMVRQPVLSRYGHVSNNISVSAGQHVRRGDNIGFIGLPLGYLTGWHLHLDVCYSNKLIDQPAHWPNLSAIRSMQAAGVSTNSQEYILAQLMIKKEVLANYIEPYKFLKDNHNI